MIEVFVEFWPLRTNHPAKRKARSMRLAFGDGAAV
jgi:hypothetical protein